MIVCGDAREVDGCGRKIGPYDCCTIVTGDAKELAPAIPDESVDLIIADPPWSRDLVDLYSWISEMAARVLKPKSFVLAYAGLSHFHLVMEYMAQRLDYFWVICGYMPSSNMVFNPRRTLNKWRPIVMFSKGWEPTLPHFIRDLYYAARDKQFHEWGQPKELPMYYIQNITQPAAFILDPFCGGGTVPAVCKMLGRHYLAFEIDPEVAERARKRVRNTQPPLFVMEPEQTEFAT